MAMFYCLSLLITTWSVTTTFMHIQLTSNDEKKINEGSFVAKFLITEEEMESSCKSSLPGDWGTKCEALLAAESHNGTAGRSALRSRQSATPVGLI